MGDDTTGLALWHREAGSLGQLTNFVGDATEEQALEIAQSPPTHDDQIRALAPRDLEDPSRRIAVVDHGLYLDDSRELTGWVAVPLGDTVWRFSRVVTKSPYRQIFLPPELLIPMIYYEDRSPYRLIRTVFDILLRGDCSIRCFEDWLILAHHPDLPFDPMTRIKPPAR